MKKLLLIPLGAGALLVAFLFGQATSISNDIRKATTEAGAGGKAPPPEGVG
jgi:hypothetical protein